MDILLIGNGFDLAHGLPTTYGDFLEFSKRINERIMPKKESVKKLFTMPVHNKRETKKTIKTLLKDNLWYYYFKEKQSELGADWCDFENEIEQVVKQLEMIKTSNLSLQNSPKNFDISLTYFVFTYLKHNNPKLEDISIEKGDFLLWKVIKDKPKTTSNRIIFPEQWLLRFSINENDYNINFSEPDHEMIINFDNFIKFIIKQLNGFTKCLELYLTCFIERKEFLRRYNRIYTVPRITYIIDKFKENDANFKIINFNYTNTIAYYIEGNRSPIDEIDDVCYIHGKGFSNPDNETPRLVLGMDEDNPQNIDHSFLAFRKYFQRNSKHTDQKCFDWITEIEKDTNQEHNLYILGHSLTKSDKQILHKLITLKNIKTTIYHIGDNEEQLNANLVIILGYEKYIEFTSGNNNAKITFKEL